MPAHQRTLTRAQRVVFGMVLALAIAAIGLGIDAAFSRPMEVGEALGLGALGAIFIVWATTGRE